MLAAQLVNSILMPVRHEINAVVSHYYQVKKTGMGACKKKPERDKPSATNAFLAFFHAAVYSGILQPSRYPI